MVRRRPAPIRHEEGAGTAACDPALPGGRQGKPWRPLGLLLVGEGLISETELAAALAAQEENGKLLGEILVDSGVVSRIAIARVLALQWGVTLEEERGYGYGLRGELERRKLPHDAPHPSEAEPAESASADGDGASSAEASVGPVGSDVPLAEPELAADEVRLTQPSSQRSERLLDRLAEQEALLGREEAVALQEHERRLKAQQQTAADIGRTLRPRSAARSRSC